MHETIYVVFSPYTNGHSSVLSLGTQHIHGPLPWLFLALECRTLSYGPVRVPYNPSTPHKSLFVTSLGLVGLKYKDNALLQMDENGATVFAVARRVEKLNTTIAKSQMLLLGRLFPLSLM